MYILVCWKDIKGPWDEVKIHALLSCLSFFPLQKILREITESGIDKSSIKHKNQQSFISSIIKGLSSGNKQLCEASTICTVDLFKAGSFVGDRSSSFFRYFVTHVQGQLHVRPCVHTYTHACIQTHKYLPPTLLPQHWKYVILNKLVWGPLPNQLR